MLFRAFIEDSGTKLLFVMSLLILSLSIFYSYRELSSEILTLPQKTPKSTINMGKSVSNNINYPSMSEWHLFGSDINKKRHKRNTEQLIEAPKTTLSLILLGIVHNEAPADSFAIIQTENDEQKLYRKGDILPGNVKLKQIGKAKVILSRSGKLESLEMIKSESVLIQN